MKRITICLAILAAMLTFACACDSGPDGTNRLGASRHLRKGVGYAEEGRHDEAITELTEAIRLGVRNAEDAYAWRGKVHISQGDFDQGIADLSKAIELDPNYVAAYIARGASYYAQGDLDRAIADLTVAIDFGADDPSVYYYRARCFRFQGEIEKAILDLEFALGMEKDPRFQRVIEQELEQLTR